MIDFYSVVSIILTVAVMITYLNHRFIRMPTTIAIMSASLILSIVLIITNQLGLFDYGDEIAEVLVKLDFHDILMHGMLNFLLFAGALFVDMETLRKGRWEIGILATVGTVCSTVLIGLATYYILPLLGMHMDFIFCILFGALISPTDPIAVLGMFKSLNAPRSMSIYLEGESLFNDGVGIVLFLTIYQVAFHGYSASVTDVLLLFLRQAVGGIFYGISLGLIAYYLMKPIDNHKVEILITLAIVTGGYALAEALHISGPLAMVVAGLFIGNHGRNFYMSRKTRENLDNFWEVIDEVLNALLFLMIGFELLLINFHGTHILLALLAIPMVLIIRFICVGIPMYLFKSHKSYFPHFIKIMTWGGLRGGLAVALALALPLGHGRNIILTMTYFVVVFAILCQGMTIKPLIGKSLALSKADHRHNNP